jgi:hypothetical protein
MTSLVGPACFTCCDTTLRIRYIADALRIPPPILIRYLQCNATVRTASSVAAERTDGQETLEKQKGLSSIADDEARLCYQPPIQPCFWHAWHDVEMIWKLVSFVDRLWGLQRHVGTCTDSSSFTNKKRNDQRNICAPVLDLVCVHRRPQEVFPMPSPLGRESFNLGLAPRVISADNGSFRSLDWLILM